MGELMGMVFSRISTIFMRLSLLVVWMTERMIVGDAAHAPMLFFSSLMP